MFRRTIFVGPALVVLICLTYPGYSQKVSTEKTKGQSPTSAPTNVGKAVVPRQEPIAASVTITASPADNRPELELKLPIARPQLKAAPKGPNAVLSLINYPWQQLGYEVVFLSPRPGFRAMTISDRRRIEIYARSSDHPIDLAYDLAHELGHAFDLERNDDERRSRWCELRGIDPSMPWFGCNRCPDYGTPAGDFAETFAFLLLGPGNYHSRLAPPPDLSMIPQLASFCGIKIEDSWCAEQIKAAYQLMGPEPPISKTSQTTSGSPP